MPAHDNYTIYLRKKIPGMFVSALETQQQLEFPVLFSIYTRAEPLYIELSTNMSLEGTTEIPKLPGNIHRCAMEISMGTCMQLFIHIYATG